LSEIFLFFFGQPKNETTWFQTEGKQNIFSDSPAEMSTQPDEIFVLRDDNV